MMVDAIRETTVKFILEKREHLELAIQVKKAMSHDVQKELVRRVLYDVECRLRNRSLEGWTICSSYNSDNKDLMEDHSYLALRRGGWSKETRNKNYASGAQLVTDRKNWESVWLGIFFPADYDDHASQSKTLEAFNNNELNYIGNLYSGNHAGEMWRSYRRFRNWSKDEFMTNALSNSDTITGELADGLVCLAEVVEAVQAHHDDEELGFHIDPQNGVDPSL